jgi:selenoprotein W-related protein
LADKIKGGFADAKVEIVEGSGGVFEVTFDGKLIYSKKETGEFPEENEILDILKG